MQALSSVSGHFKAIVALIIIVKISLFCNESCMLTSLQVPGENLFSEVAVPGYLEDQISVLNLSPVDTNFFPARILMNSNDCYGCHTEDKTIIGPSFIDVATKYKRDKGALLKLSNKIISGGTGVWGELEMPPHPDLLREDAQTIVNYILHLGRENEVKR